ncbi:bcl-2-modifying factor isoform X2 [Mixophyes fleayi]|uniref:bcl-2-modifying factor isoform X2 n=1 Tax=Mixophyes fleayi TaxID=3061075 RepID=UPI003F4DCC66
MNANHSYREELCNTAGEGLPSTLTASTLSQKMEREIFLGSEELDDDVFYPNDFGLPGQPLTPLTMYTHSPSYNCLLGRFQLFPLSHCCGPGCRTTDCKDKSTQTLEPSSVNRDVMLPCGVSESPQRLFYGNAGYLLHQPAEAAVRFGEETEYQRQEQSAEGRIARKLQFIGDQFQRLHLQRVQQNQNQVWFQILIFFRNLAIHHDRDRGDVQR